MNIAKLQATKMVQTTNSFFDVMTHTKCALKRLQHSKKSLPYLNDPPIVGITAVEVLATLERISERLQRQIDSEGHSSSNTVFIYV